MGIKGTVKRSTDGDFIHANVDIDLIITEEPEIGNIEKPVEIFHIIEHFCLGRRRLHLFGRDSTIRPGKTSGGGRSLAPGGRRQERLQGGGREGRRAGASLAAQSAGSPGLCCCSRSDPAASSTLLGPGPVCALSPPSLTSLNCRCS